MELRKKLIDVEKAMNDIKKLLMDTHDITQKKKSYNYKGIDLKHYKILAGSSTIKESMKKSNLDWQREEHGIEMLDTILLKIFQLGYEQAQIEFEIKTEEEKRFKAKM